MGITGDAQGETKVQDGRRNNGGARPGAGRKTKQEELRSELRRLVTTHLRPIVEKPKPQARADKPKVQDGRRNNGGARPGAGRKRKIAQIDPNKFLSPEEDAAVERLLRDLKTVDDEHKAERDELSPNATEQTSVNGSKQGKRRRGRQPGDENFDRHRFLADLDHAIRDLKSKGVKERDITRKRVTREYKLGAEFISPDALTKRLRLCGVNSEFPSYVESRLKVSP